MHNHHFAVAKNPAMTPFNLCTSASNSLISISCSLIVRSPSGNSLVATRARWIFILMVDVAVGRSLCESCVGGLAFGEEVGGGKVARDVDGDELERRERRVYKGGRMS